MSRPPSHYGSRGMISKPVEVSDRDTRNAAALGSQALLAALNAYFLSGGRG